ncbi:AAA family ATPase [Aureivirga sp. CE67]|uniref:AAA family ATPase n=1 Tax=Aureivirga sp. CE67 TaxID=1788983 RepID=UPI0018C9E08E|nr:MoxR family ATPase [Aureivirga sp. CE67]
MEENKEISFESRVDLESLKNAIEKIKDQVGRVLVGQEEFLEFLIIALLSDGHVLIEGVPGIAKTVTAKMLAKTIATEFNRIQFTPDLMPSDVIGTSVLNMSTTNFEFKPGPIFSNLVLIDEINRAPAKTQSALFEVMEEKQITVDGITYNMQSPFMVLATQNPIEQEGTYALPEAQLDRFLFKIMVEYPSVENEIKILQMHNERKGKKQESYVESIISESELKEIKESLNDIIVNEKLFAYIVEIISKTRTHQYLSLGGSPRASLAILQASKASAAIKGRDFVTPDDVKKVIPAVLRHRIILTPEKEMEGMTADKVIEMIVQSVEVPR